MGQSVLRRGRQGFTRKQDKTSKSRCPTHLNIIGINPGISIGCRPPVNVNKNQIQIVVKEVFLHQKSFKMLVSALSVLQEFDPASTRPLTNSKASSKKKP